MPTNLKTQETPENALLSFCALQACLEGVQVVATEIVVSEIGIFASSTCNFYIVILDRMKKKKYNPIVGNIWHFDNEINLARMGAWKAFKSTTSSLRRSFRLLRWSHSTKRCLRISMTKWRNCTFLHSSHVELECGTTPLVRDDSAMSHLMGAQLG